MITKEFENGLIVKSRKSAIVFETNSELENGFKFSFSFTEDEFKTFFNTIHELAIHSWGKITPKEAQSEASDYWEYYDRKLDNNGYLTIKENELCIDRPSLECERLYQFNKRKMESFLYDLEKKFDSLHIS